jgi:hypothetical protein
MLATLLTPMTSLITVQAFKKENGKRMPRRFPFIRLPFAHHANGSLPFVRLCDKETNGKYPFANELNRLNGLAHLCLLLEKVHGSRPARVPL